MSSAAAWSYTARATIWPRRVEPSAWNAGDTFDPPVLIACDYRAESKLMRTAQGDEFTSVLQIHTEHATAARGDRIAIGDHRASDLPVLEAAEVMLVTRVADSIERLADDYILVT